MPPKTRVDLRKLLISALPQIQDRADKVRIFDLLNRSRADLVVELSLEQIVKEEMICERESSQLPC